MAAGLVVAVVVISSMLNRRVYCNSLVVEDWRQCGAKEWYVTAEVVGRCALLSTRTRRARVALWP